MSVIKEKISTLFFELIQVAFANKEALTVVPSGKEWADLYRLAKEQSLVGICFYGIQRLPETQRPEEDLYYKWMGTAAKIQQRNEFLNEECVRLQSHFMEAGFNTIVLKGQGLLPYYGNLGGFRQTGDIDLWIDGDANAIEDYVRSHFEKYYITKAHIEIELHDEITVELHIHPAMLRCPWLNSRLQNWFVNNKSKINAVEIDNHSFTTASTEFNIVFLLVHLYHHVLMEGVGLRQFMDYYFVLKSIEKQDSSMKHSFVNIIDSLGMHKFAQGVMWIMHNIFALENDKLLMDEDVKVGNLLLKEALIGGNFGKYDKRDSFVASSNPIARVIGGIKRNVRFFSIAPAIVICNPFWRLWHFCWMKVRGYR